MFAYTDPTETTLLQDAGALLRFRNLIDSSDTSEARRPGSRYTRRDAFENLAHESATVEWKAFPLLSQAQSNEEIDTHRFRLQDEYIEWLVERDAQGAVETITFTTEFPDYFEILAQTGIRAIKTGVRSLYPGANPTNEELFGSGFDVRRVSSKKRGQAFRKQLPRNPYNNGEKGILCLSHGSNTLGALFGLVGPCAVPRSDLAPSGVCSALGGGCVPGRSSDPFVCAAVQNLARGGNGLTFNDPVGIQILRHAGSWQRGEEFLDINDSDQAGDIWIVSRGRHRAVLKARGLKLEGEAITSGAQVARQLMVGAQVLWAPEAALPAWARTDNESSRVIA